MFLCFHRNPTAYRRLTGTAALLLTSAGVGGLFATTASAQVVYDSTANPITPAAQLVPTNTPEGPVGAATDDYATTLAGTATSFQLTSLTFFGGVQFTGAANGVNNVLVFRFLGETGGIPDPLTRVEVAFQTSGSFLQTIDFTNAIIPTVGILEVTTLPNSGAIGTFAFTNTPPAVGLNNPAGGNPPGIRAFALRGNVVAAPEPGTLALVAAGMLPVAGMVVARRRKA